MAKGVSRRLQGKERNYVDYCEKYYFLNRGGFPTPEQAALSLGYTVTEINYFLLNTQVQAALYSRGLDYRNSGSSNELSPTQIACAITVANFADTRTVEVKLDEMGIQPAQYFAWLNDEKYQKFAKNVANQSLDNIHPEAVASFQRLIRNGDFNAIKYYFEITGVNQSQDVANLKSVIQLLIESVQRHVKDPVILGMISQEIMGLVPGLNSTTVRLELEDAPRGSN